MENKSLTQDLANAIRVLSAQAVNQANSGHPGMPMGMADIASTLWLNHLQHSPNNPKWINRDRFVLSNGHGSMLLYALLHLTGYPLSMEQIKQFRQLHSQTPGHPEHLETCGVETTTGPLGQGFANAVGMNLSYHWLAERFNTKRHTIISHYTYVFLGDGCLMEGVSHEAASLAGHLGCSKLIAFYDDNQITIDGTTQQTFTENTRQRFESYNWAVLETSGHDINGINTAIVQAKQNTQQPVLIICKTNIGQGAPNKVGTASCHGAPLGQDETEQLCKNLGWSTKPFDIPNALYQQADARRAGDKKHQEWQTVWKEYQENNPEKAKQLQRFEARKLPEDTFEGLMQWAQQHLDDKTAYGTRQTSQKIHHYLTKILPECVGGSADLAASNLTAHPHTKYIHRGCYNGNAIHFGVREFGMAAVANGMYLHGFLRPYVATFLVFSDYARNAIRMSAMMKIGMIYIMTHDSIGVGEDGPTHQPIEHISSLRLIPDLYVWRPCDFQENLAAWFFALKKQDAPTLLALSRQKLTPYSQKKHWEGAQKGGYILSYQKQQPHVVLIATGSEVGIAMDAQKRLEKHSISANVVSVPCKDLLDEQPNDYKETLMPESAFLVAIEAGSTPIWYEYVGKKGAVVGLDRFGASAPASRLYEAFKLTAEHVVDLCLKNRKNKKI